MVAKLYDLALDGSRDIYNKLRFKQSIVDKKCCIDATSRLAPNCHLLEGVVFLNSSIRSHSYIGKNSTIQNTRIGAFCSIASNVQIGLGQHPLNLFSTSPLFYRKINTFKVQAIDRDNPFLEYRPIEIGNDVWIGLQSIILDGVKIGDGAVVAAGSVVTKDIPPYAIFAGVPAKLVRYRFSREKIEALTNSKWWDLPLGEIMLNIDIYNGLVNEIYCSDI
jgi:acetyltransferase-like isoleucine patch superfamily enzyme